MISGFSILKDVLQKGYPFAEAIASALPICDEFLIAEGYSTDGTYEVIQRIASLNKKVKVFRQHWPETKKPSIVADLTNAIRKKCKYDYIFHVQVNEIVHEKSIESIKSLPEMYPEAQTFSLPYKLLTRNYMFNQEFRVRFSKNCSHVISIGDALTLGLTRGFIASEAFKGLRDPREFVRLIANGVKWNYANFPATEFSRAIYLPQPIFRYWSLFPRDHLKKLAGQAKIFGFAHYNKEVEILKPYVDDPSTFWKISSANARVNGAIGRCYPESLRFVEKDEHPRIMQDFFSDQSSTHDSYYVRQEVLNLLRGL